MASTQQVIELEPGQTIVLPAGAQIDSWITTGDTTLTSTCDDLPEEDEYVCIAFLFADSHSGDAAFDVMTIDTIEVGGTTFDINIEVDESNPAADYAININLITGAIFNVYGVRKDDLSDRTEWAISARVPSNLLDTVKFKVSGTGWGPSGAYVIHQLETDCDCAFPSSGDQDESFCEEPET